MPVLACLLLTAGLCSTSHEPVVVVADDPVAIEAESVAIAPGWVLEHEIPGHQGDGYLRWQAPDAYNTPGSGELRYHVLISRPGRYHLRLRLNTRGAERSDLGNDVFTRVDAGPWVKTFVGGGSPEGWATRTRLEPSSHQFAEAVYDLTTGRHTIAVSGRSHGLRFDRLVLWRDGGQQPSDTITAAHGVPPVPPEIDDAAVRDAWRLGGLGAVLGWAGKRAKDPRARLATDALQRHADERLAAITAWRERDALVACDLLENLAAQYQGSERGRELAKLLRQWAADPAVAQERKAKAMADAVGDLLGRWAEERDVTRKQAMADGIREALTRMRRSVAGTISLRDLEQRVTAAGIGTP